MRLKKMIQILSTGLSALSVLLLLQHAFLISDYSETIKHMLRYYDTLIGVCFGWLSPVSEWFVQLFSKIFDWKLKLFPHWKHVFVILWLYFISSSRMIFTRSKSWLITLTGIVGGAVIALVSAAIAGSVYPNEKKDYLLIALFPILGVVLFEICISCAKSQHDKKKGVKFSKTFFKGFKNYVLPAILLGSIALYYTTKLPSFDPNSFIINAGLVGLGFFIILLSSYWFIHSIIKSIIDREDGELFKDRVFRSGGFQLSRIVFNTIIAVTFLLLTNAGLSFVGL